MTAPYSLDLRERVLARKEADETNREIAAALWISRSCVSKWTKRKRETGSLAPAQIGGYKPRTLSGESADWCGRASPAGRSRCEACRPIGRAGDQHASPGGMGVRSRRGPELQKKRCWPRNRRVLTSRASGRDGRPIRAGSRPRGSCSSTRPG
jgi:transposase